MAGTTLEVLDNGALSGENAPPLFVQSADQLIGPATIYGYVAQLVRAQHS